MGKLAETQSGNYLKKIKPSVEKLEIKARTGRLWCDAGDFLQFSFLKLLPFGLSP